MWVSLMIGNSRLHWAVHEEDGTPAYSWHSQYLGEANDQEDDEAGRETIPQAMVNERAMAILIEGGWERSKHGDFLMPSSGAFLFAGVVPSEVAAWCSRCPHALSIRGGPESNIIEGTSEYATLGVDRSLAMRGAGSLFGWPVLVIDCGSAMTFNAVDSDGVMKGGAILPGIKLQLKALNIYTAQLPAVTSSGVEVPSRWAMTTENSIKSGILYVLAAGAMDFIDAFRQEHSEGHIVFTGGDGELLYSMITSKMKETSSPVTDKIHLVPDLIHHGIAALRPALLHPSQSHSSNYA